MYKTAIGVIKTREDGDHCLIGIYAEDGALPDHKIQYVPYQWGCSCGDIWKHPLHLSPLLLKESKEFHISMSNKIMELVKNNKIRLIKISINDMVGLSLANYISIQQIITAELPTWVMPTSIP